MDTGCDISIIVPVYNGERYLPECVESVLASSGAERFELLLVDDGSTDGSAACIARLAAEHANVRGISYGGNRGPSAARNAGLEQAKGAYICFVDSDDCLEPEYLSRLLARAKDTHAQIVFGGHSLWRDGEVTKAERAVLDGSLGTGMDYLNRRMDADDQHNYIWAALFERQFLTERGIRFCEELRLYEDILFTAQACADAERVTAVPEYGYRYRVHSESLVQGGVKLRDVEQSTLLLGKLKEELLKGSPVGRITIQALSMCLYYIGQLTDDGTLTGKDRKECFETLTELELLPLLKGAARTKKERVKWLLWRVDWRLFYPLVKKK